MWPPGADRAAGQPEPEHAPERGDGVAPAGQEGDDLVGARVGEEDSEREAGWPKPREPPRQEEHGAPGPQMKREIGEPQREAREAEELNVRGEAQGGERAVSDEVARSEDPLAPALSAGLAPLDPGQGVRLERDTREVRHEGPRPEGQQEDDEDPAGEP